MTKMTMGERPLVAVCGNFESVHFFRMDTGEKSFSVSLGNEADSGACCSSCRLLQVDEDVLGVGVETEVQFIDPRRRMALERESLRPEEPGMMLAVLDLPSDPFGMDLVAAGGEEMVVWVWKKAEKEVRAELRGHVGQVTRVCSVPSRKWLASGSWDDTVRLWDLEVGRPVPDGVWTLSSIVDDLILLRDDSFLAASGDGVVKMFSSGHPSSIRSFRLPFDRSPCSLLRHETDEFLFFVGNHVGEVLLWDIRNEDRCVDVRQVHEKPVSAMVSVGEGRCGSCSSDQKVKLWTVKLKVFRGGVEGREAEGGTEMTTESWNWDLCCVVPFRESGGSQELDEKLQFLLGGGGEDGIVGTMIPSMFVGLRHVGGSVRVFRFIR